MKRAWRMKSVMLAGCLATGISFAAPLSAATVWQEVDLASNSAEAQESELQNPAALGDSYDSAPADFDFEAAGGAAYGEADADDLVSMCAGEETSVTNQPQHVSSLHTHYYCQQPRHYASIGAVLLHRSRPNDGTFIAGNPGGASFLRGDVFDFDTQAGPEIVLGYAVTDLTTIEGRYFSVDHLERNTFVAPGNFIGAGFTGPGGTRFDSRYATMLDSAEINARRSVSDRLTFIYGVRWFELRDELTTKLNGNVATGRYSYDNRMIGGQLGANLDLLPSTSRFSANVEGKAGWYSNQAKGGIFEYQGNNFIGSFEGENTTTSSFVGEINFNTSYKLTRHMALRAGYQLMWLEDIALASDAASRSLLNPSLLRQVQAEQDLFYHGATTGLEFLW